jgi:hypothetical protein
MTTWIEIKDYASSQYQFDKEDDDYFTLIFTYEDRKQKILVTKIDAFEQEFIEFRTTVCKEADLNPRVALQENASLAIGALALVDGLYLLIYRSPINQLDIEEFELPLHALATARDTLEEKYSTGGDVY